MRNAKTNTRGPSRVGVAGATQDLPFVSSDTTTRSGLISAFAVPFELVAATRPASFPRREKRLQPFPALPDISRTVSEAFLSPDRKRKKYPGRGSARSARRLIFRNGSNGLRRRES